MLLILALVLILGAVAVLGSAMVRNEQPSGVARSLEALEKLGTPNAAELAQDVDRPFAERIVEPLQARALAIGRRMTGADKAEQLRHKLDLAGNPRDWSVDRVVSLKVMAGIVLPICGLAYGFLLGFGLTTNVIIVIVMLLVGFFAPDLYLYQRAYNRSEEIKKTLADAVDLLTISVEAGLGFDAGLQQVARNTEGALASELSRVLREMQLGQSRSDALKGMAERTNVDDLKTFVGAMVQADAFGISIAQVLRVQSAEIRVKRRQYAESKAQQVPVKMMVPLVLCILPCLFVVIIGPAVLGIMGQF